MVNVEFYIHSLIALLKGKFGNRLVYVGLQGSYLRAEATENSDIDIMVVIDGLRISDLNDYRRIIESLGHADKSCGFICSTEDLAHWNPLEMCHLIHSTKDFHGSLIHLIPGYSREDIRNFVKISINNLYHEICHRYIHGSLPDNKSGLPLTYKGVFFILQNLHYLRTGAFIGTKAELLSALEGKDRAVLLQSMEMQSDAFWNFEESFALLYHWCQETLVRI